MYGHQKQGIMTLEEAQKEVDRWIKTYGVRYFSELTNMAVLTEEVGELARVKERKTTLPMKWQMYCGSLSVWPTRPE